MITDDNKKLAQWAMEYALKNGCQAAKLVLYTNSNSSFELRDGKMDRLQQSTENGLGLNLYVDGRFGSFSTNRLDKKELETLITNGIESTRYLAVDESRMLADPARYYKGASTPHTDRSQMCSPRCRRKKALTAPAGGPSDTSPSAGPR